MELVTWKYCIEAANQCSARMNCTDCCMVNCVGTPTWAGIAVFAGLAIFITVMVYIANRFWSDVGTPDDL